MVDSTTAWAAFFNVTPPNSNKWRIASKQSGKCVQSKITSEKNQNWFNQHAKMGIAVPVYIMEIGVEFLYVVMCEYTNDWIKIKLQECLVYLISILIVSCYIYFTHDFIDIFIQQYITHLVLFMILYTREDFALRSLQ